MVKQMSGGKPRFGAIRGYADGGKVAPTSFRGLFNSAKSAISNAIAPETPEQGAARRAAEYEAMKAKYGAKQAQPQQVAQPPATGVGNGLDGAGGNSVDNRLKAAGAYRDGGKIKGPGTPTSDSIPARVVQTGEPIKVGTGERIVSAKQEAFLADLAKDFGFKSVDAMLEAGTGTPVGPTVEYSGNGDDEFARGSRVRKQKQPAMKQSNPKRQSQSGGTGEKSPLNPSASEAEVSDAVIDQHIMTTSGASDVGITPGFPSRLDEKKAFMYGGAIRRGFEGGGGPNDLAKQIPTGGVPGRGPTAQLPSQPGVFDGTRAVSREVLADVNEQLAAGNTSGAVGRAYRGGLATLAAGASDAGGALVNAAGEVLTPVGNAISNAFTGENLGSVNQAQAATQHPPKTQPGAAPSTTPPVSDAYPQEQSRAPAANVPSAPAGAIRSKDVGHGVTRIDQEGKSPLFTNLPGGAENPSNIALQNRGAVTPENQSAMNGIQARQDASDQVARNKMQYDAEVAQAQAINAGQKQFHLEQAALKGNKGALALIQGSTTDATNRRGQDITAKGQDVQAGAVRANQQLARDRFGIEQSQESRNAAKFGAEAKQQERLQAAFDAYEKDPSEENAAKVRVYTGKEKAPAPDLYDKFQSGVDPATGNPIYNLYNKRTGEMPGQAKAQPYPEGTQLKGKDGKSYVVKNGKPVPI